MTAIALVSSIIISTGSLAWAFAEAGLFVLARWALIFGVVWLFAQWRGWRWFSSFGLLVVVLVSAISIWLGFSAEWLFSGTVFALFAWDMTDFRQRMRDIAIDENLHAMERRRVARITFFSFIGLFFASMMLMLVRGKFTLEWGALLVVVILFGVAQLVSWLKR